MRLLIGAGPNKERIILCRDKRITCRVFQTTSYVFEISFCSSSTHTSWLSAIFRKINGYVIWIFHYWPVVLFCKSDRYFVTNLS